jgi:hypothetical protein
MRADFLDLQIGRYQKLLRPFDAYKYRYSLKLYPTCSRNALLTVEG